MAHAAWQKRYGHNSSLLGATFTLLYFYLYYNCAVCEAITAFNDGARSTKTLFQKLNLSSGHNTIKALNLRNNIRLRNSRLKKSGKYKKQGQRLLSHHKNKSKDDSSYIPGGFSSHVTPDTLVSTVKKKKISGTEISFIHQDVSVMLVVINNLI